MEMNLSSQEKISALLDGELLQEEIGSLFLDLHNNDGLQNELLSDIQLRQLTPTQLVAPPANVKEDILSAVAVNATTSAPAYFDHSIIYGLLVTIASAVGVFALIQPTSDSFADNAKSFMSIPHKSVETSIPANGADNLTLADLNNLAPAPIELAIERPRPAYSFVSQRAAADSPAVDRNITAAAPIITNSAGEITTDATNLAANASISNTNDNNVPDKLSILAADESISTSNGPILAIELANIAPAASNSLSYDRNLSFGTINPALAAAGPANLFASSTDYDLPITLTLRGVSAASSVQVDVDRGSVPAFNNFAIGALYNLTDNFSLGLEFGQEDYNQVFEGIDKHDRVFYQQILTALWGGVTANYNTGNIIGDNVSLYSNATLGGTRVGLIGRIGTGFGFDITDKIVMNTGLELNGLVYRHQEKAFNTIKYGVTYGIAYTP
jgi:hypothetical protein